MKGWHVFNDKLAATLLGMVSACAAGGGGRDGQNTIPSDTTSATTTGAGGALTLTGGSSGGGPGLSIVDQSSELCEPETGPFCGDGMVNQASEICDDGNVIPGDGCTGVCSVEPYFDCPAGGGSCTSTLRCGDGVRSPGESCDDGNNADGDGCNADCSYVDPGYYCPTPGQPCVRSEGECGDARVQPGETCDDGNQLDGDGCTALCRVEAGFRCTQPGAPCIEVPVCGNGRVESAEECDDENTNSGDGCSSTCRLEPGFKCPAPGAPCEATVCGDGQKEGSECCDDGNLIALDGCMPDCRCEPVCPTAGGCTASCGNGIVEDGEGCDDGNTASADGCSANCQEEDGFSCEVPPCEMVNGECALTVPVVYRDFNASDSSNGHPDFQPGYNSTGVTTGLVETQWDDDQKPVQSSTASVDNGFMHGQDAFRQWYRSEGEPGGSGSRASAPIASTITLWPKDDGGFVNRFGAGGEPWVAYATGEQWCSNTSCDDCGTPPAGMVCRSPCPPWGNQACFVEEEYYDGNPLFFPLDPPTATIQNDTRLEAKVPEQYGWNGWPWEIEVAERLNITTPIETATSPFPTQLHNFHFTTEVKWWFRYDPDAPMQLDFTGDDDVWVFVNGRLAVDLGGWHVPEDGSVTLGPATASSFGLEEGGVYTIGIFHAERQPEGSSFKLTLSGFALVPSECTPTCGDGVVTVFEECDEGSANSDDACGACRTDCSFGPRCGDGTVQSDCGEECDDGVNIGGYNQCAPGCVPAERCGDGVTQEEFGEQCDDGDNNGVEGYCTAGCGVPAFCGDGVVQAPETCDNGINDNSYGGCSSDCQFGPRCGDGVVQTEFGEACDLGAENLDDVYGGCTAMCELGAHCGDGAVQGPEQCDPGAGGVASGDASAEAGCNANNSSCSETCRTIADVR